MTITTTTTTTKLPIEFKQKWIDALRNGEYKQGKNFLASNNFHESNGYKYCCLGLACLVSGHNVEDIFGIEMISPTNTPLVPIELSENILKKTLSTMNDLHGASFQQIADWIEKNL